LKVCVKCWDDAAGDMELPTEARTRG